MPGKTSAIGLLRGLLAVSIVLPAVLFAATAWFSWGTAFDAAAGDLRRSVDIAREHAEKLFDSQDQVIDRVNDLVRDRTADDIKQSEKAYHDALAAIVVRLPQVQSVMVAGRDGTPLASAGLYPIPAGVRVDKRDYFVNVVGGGQGDGEPYVSVLQVGDINANVFFGLARPWTGPDRSIKGVIDVAVLPAFFQDFYGALLGEAPDARTGKVMTLLRDDGQILARFPPVPGTPRRTPVSPEFFKAIAVSPASGTYERRSTVEQNGPTRLFAYRQVDGFPLYVVAGLSRAVIVDGWRASLFSHLAYGLPATIALVAAIWTALVRARREQAALGRAEREIARREAAEAALLKAQRLDAVGQMTGGVAHDFNNLLTVILGSAEMLTRRPDEPARVRRLAEQIIRAARNGSNVTQQLLTFSRRQYVRPETVDLNARLVEFKQLLDQAASEAVEVTLELEHGLHPVRLDPGHFEAAVLNLVGNARDAMPGGGRVVVRTRNLVLGGSGPAELPPGAYVEVSVADTGTGMPPETVAKVFEPFFTTKEVGRGTGLGLSQVYGFVKQAGGDVQVSSVVGHGSVVTMLLPRAAGGWDAAAAAQGASEPATGDEVVLVVEDQAEVRAMAVESLHDLGYATRTASTAQEALLAIEAPGRIDVLFSDVVMPGGMTGLQLSSEARRRRPGLKVLLTSGYAPAEAAAAGEEVRTAAMLTKPYEQGQLAHALREVLRE